MLLEAYAKVPRRTLSRLTWQDSVPSFASPQLGVVVSSKRASSLVWIADSTAILGGGNNSQLYVRRPGDFALLLVLAHELSHLALQASTASIAATVAEIECATDILGGFQTAALSLRISSGGLFELTINRVPTLLGHALRPGHWVAGDQHPDREQRIACLTTGVNLFADQQEREDVADVLLSESRSDSVRNQLARRDVPDRRRHGGSQDDCIGSGGPTCATRAAHGHALRKRCGRAVSGDCRAPGVCT